MVGAAPVSKPLSGVLRGSALACRFGGASGGVGTRALAGFIFTGCRSDTEWMTTAIAAAGGVGLAVAGLVFGASAPTALRAAGAWSSLFDLSILSLPEPPAEATC